MKFDLWTMEDQALDTVHKALPDTYHHDKWVSGIQSDIVFDVECAVEKSLPDDKDLDEKEVRQLALQVALDCLERYLHEDPLPELYLSNPQILEVYCQNFDEVDEALGDVCSLVELGVDTPLEVVTTAVDEWIRREASQWLSIAVENVRSELE